MSPELVVFTSWKEIASNLRKGVRTVQRWEVQFGLPIRMPDARKGIICATRDDLDRWLSTRWSSSKPAFSDELAVLRKKVAELTRENATLKRELAQRERGNGSRAEIRERPAKKGPLLANGERIVTKDELASFRH